MSRFAVLTDDQWARIEPLMPCSDGRRGHPFRDHRQVVEGIVYRYRRGIAWRDLPEVFGPWQTVWTRHKRFRADGTWDAILAELVARADAVGVVDWAVSVDSTFAVPTSTRSRFRATQGDLSNHTNLGVEPAGHAIGRSRGGLSTKIPHACDGRGRPLVVLIGPVRDSPMFGSLLDSIRVAGHGPGRPAPGRLRCSRTGPTPHAETEPCCVVGASPP